MRVRGEISRVRSEGGGPVTTVATNVTGRKWQSREHVCRAPAAVARASRASIAGRGSQYSNQVSVRKGPRIFASRGLQLQCERAGVLEMRNCEYRRQPASLVKKWTAGQCRLRRTDAFLCWIAEQTCPKRADLSEASDPARPDEKGSESQQQTQTTDLPNQERREPRRAPLSPASKPSVVNTRTIQLA